LTHILQKKTFILTFLFLINCIYYILYICRSRNFSSPLRQLKGVGQFQTYIANMLAKDAYLPCIKLVSNVFTNRSCG